LKIHKIFNVEKPGTLVYSEQIPDPNGIIFVSSSGRNVGKVRRVKYNPKNKLYQKGAITVPLKGSVLMAYIQPEDFYVAHQIAVLTPIDQSMSIEIKQYYCLAIQRNAYRYNYGRQADKTLEYLELPDKIPDFVNNKNFYQVADDIINTALDSLNEI
jgi:hypothetical protein